MIEAKIGFKKMGASALQAKWDLQYTQILRHYGNSHNESFPNVLAKAFLLNWQHSEMGPGFNLHFLLLEKLLHFTHELYP